MLKACFQLTAWVALSAWLSYLKTLVCFNSDFSLSTHVEYLQNSGTSYVSRSLLLMVSILVAKALVSSQESLQAQST